MRVLLIALLAAISYAQTVRNLLKLKKLRKRFGCDDDNDGAGDYIDLTYADQTHLIVGAYGNIDNCIVAAAAEETFCDTESNAIMCCETCTILKAGEYSKDYVDAKRIITQNNWYTEVFTVTAEELDDFIANVAPKYWSETSQVIIPVAGTYTGPEEITEYYLLQNGDFTMGRHYLDPLDPCEGDYIYTSDETTMDTQNPGYALYGLINGHIFGGCDPTSDGTTNSYTYDDANSILPNTVVHNFAESSVLFTVGLYGDNEELCTELMARCDGENQQYDSMEDCLEYHENMKQIDQESGCPLLSGHTTACHWTHMYLSGLRPGVHCYHSGKEIVDPYGKLACSMEQCTIQSDDTIETVCNDDNDGAGAYLDLVYADLTHLIVGAYGNIDNCIVAAAAEDAFCDTESNAIMCCEICTILKAEEYSKDYVDAKRIITQNNWYTEVFTVTAEELDDFMANVAPKYWSETSQVIIPVAGTYTGPEEITEYYLLQNGDFTMGRHYLDPLDPCEGDYIYTSDESTMDTQNPGYALYGLINGHLFGGCDPTSDGTTNSYTFDDANSIRPNTVTHNFAESSVLFTIGLYGDNEELCTELMERCDGENQQYDSMEDCLEYHEDMKQIDQESGCPLLSGHTTACHWTHMYLSGLRPEVHCYHSGKEIVDPYGKLACSMEQCTIEPEVNVENCQAAFDAVSQSFSLTGCCWEDYHCSDGEACSRGDSEDPGFCEAVDASTETAPSYTNAETEEKVAAVSATHPSESMAQVSSGDHFSFVLNFFAFIGMLSTLYFIYQKCFKRKEYYAVVHEPEI